MALGNFDGVHRGHRQVLAPILSQGAIASNPDPDRRPVATVVTFSPHPKAFFTGTHRPLLTPLDEKICALADLGVEQLVLIPFDQTLADLSPREFVQQILIDGLHTQHISVGQDFCFGRDRSGTVDDLRQLAEEFGATVTIVPLYGDGGDRISSSAIRHALDQGQVQQAQHLLGRPYRLTGSVVQGQQLGRTIGFPTANLQVPPQKLLPCYGVYAVWVEGAGGDRWPGVMNIGRRPTVDGTHTTVEIHLLSWQGDLYHKTLTVSLQAFLRPEQKFASLDALKLQIQQDCQAALQLLTPAG